MAVPQLQPDGAGVAVPETCALMAARLRQVARDQRKVVNAVVRGALSEAVARAEQRFAIGSTLGRNVWGSTNKRGTFRVRFWRGQRKTARQLGLVESHVGGKHHLVSSYHSPKNALGTYSRIRDRARVQSRSVSAVTGKKAYPLIVGFAKTRWVGDVLKTGVTARGIAAHIEDGIPFKSHTHPMTTAPDRVRDQATGRYQAAVGRKQHPGGKVHKRPTLDPALRASTARLGQQISSAVAAFMSQAFGKVA